MLRQPWPWEAEQRPRRMRGEQHLRPLVVPVPGSHPELELPADRAVRFDDGTVNRRTVVDRVADRIVRESHKPQYVRPVTHAEARQTARRIRLRKEAQGRH